MLFEFVVDSEIHGCCKNFDLLAEFECFGSTCGWILVWNL